MPFFCLQLSSSFLMHVMIVNNMNSSVSKIACGSFTLKHRLQVGHWNLKGLISKQFGSKLELDEVLKTIESCHTFNITETHLLPSNGKQLARYKDFHYFCKNGKRKNYNSGGLSVYIRDEISNGVSVIHGEIPAEIWV